MSMFGSIMSKIFGAAAPMAEKASAQAAPMAASAPPSSVEPPASPSPQATPPLSSPESTPSAAQALSQPVDVAAILTHMASEKGDGGNWQTSIVDLLKLLGLSSSLDARKELADELNVHAGADGSAEQNIALHKSVMQKLAENGGNVPESMKG
jgi:hypothetical protein